MTSMLDAALDYAARGWPIFPCRSDKKPYSENGVLDATTNKKQIKEWWREFPKANIGLAVDRCSMMVLDLDPGHSIKDLEAVIGKLPETKLVQETPRGGKHLFYQIKSDEIIPPSASKLAKNVDVRSFNSYVLLEPSRTSDGEYTWVSEGKPAYRSDAMAEKAKEKSRQQSEDHDTWLIEQDLEENVDLAIAWLKDKAEIAIEGVNGDHKAYATAAMMKSYGLSPELARDLMWEHWNPRCMPPWSADQIDHFESKVENGYTYNTSPPGNMTPAYKVAKAQAKFTAISRDINEEKGSIEITSGRFRAVDRQGMEDIKPPEWLIKDLIPEESYGTLVGQPGSFKTFLALDIGLSLATGASDYFDDGEWHGMWPEVTRAGPVLFVAGEGRSAMIKRVRAWEKRHLDGDRVSGNFILMDPVPHPTEDDFDHFISAAQGWHDEYALVILDTVGKSMQGLNENSQQDVSTFTKLVQSIQAELCTSVLALHHTGHEGTRARGSSVFKGDVDYEYVVERDEGSEFVTLKNTKQKDAPEWTQPRIAQVVQVKLGQDKLGQDQASLVAVRPSERKEEEKVQQTIAAKAGRRSKREKAIASELLRSVAYGLMKDAPGKEWSMRALGMAVANSDQVEVGFEAVRKQLPDAITSDKKHPISKCYDPAKQKWIYRK